MMYYVCHDRRGHKLRHNVGTCLRHVSMQTTMYQGIGGAASCESSTLCAYLICLRKQKWTETPFLWGESVHFDTLRRHFLSESATLIAQLLSVLSLLYDSLECFRVVHSEVSEHLAVDLDTCLVKHTHELRV